ncbi:YfgG family protein [Serratia rhizosphaerae]|uniref:DUF2633 family protein n=1 Tax=Serratia rhizosphaerae TaxID=2597702 RepID=A0ABX6GQF2_9GAMM|nr:YfgG family protein [Serratia rhizosphaerae]MEB6336304.1 YfgG family protein [Serratia rhizosphaerae]QHA88493.1 DUF2633 family protein [Serratia rhizosphaerae]
MRKRTTGQMTKIVLLVSFIILIGRLLYTAIAAIPHHQEKQLSAQEQHIRQPLNSPRDNASETQ